MGLRSDPIPESPLVVGETPRRRAASPFTGSLSGNDSLPDSESAVVFIRRPDGRMVPITADFPFSSKLVHITGAYYPYGDPDAPPFLNLWRNWSNTQVVAAFARDFVGCVWMQGLVKGGTVAQNVFVTPEGYRQTSAGGLIYPSIALDAIARWDAVAAGGIKKQAGSATWSSMAFINYPTEGRIAWKSPSFENGWVNYGLGWASAAYAKDALGRVWIRGLIKNGTDAVAAFTLPEGYRPSKDVHRTALADANVLAKTLVYADGTVRPNVLAGSTSWHTITMVFMADGAAGWTEIGAAGAPPFENSWVNYGGQWDTAAFFKDAAGVVHIKGLIKSGTLNTVFTLPVGYRPRMEHTWPIVSNNAFGKLIINSLGEVKVATGSATWFTLHCSFIAEQ